MSTPQPPPEQLKAWILERQQIEHWMSIAKVRETELRKLIASAIFTPTENGFFREGTSNARPNVSGDIYNAKLKQPWKREILVEVMEATLTEAALTPEVRDALVKKSYELSVTAYRALPEVKQKVVDKMLKVTAGTPSLELEHFPAATA